MNSTAIYKGGSSDPRELHRFDVLCRRVDRALWQVLAFRKGRVYLRRWGENAKLKLPRRELRLPSWSVTLRFLV